MKITILFGVFLGVAWAIPFPRPNSVDGGVVPVDQDNNKQGQDGYGVGPIQPSVVPSQGTGKSGAAFNDGVDGKDGVDGHDGNNVNTGKDGNDGHDAQTRAKPATLGRTLSQSTLPPFPPLNIRSRSRLPSPRAPRCPSRATPSRAMSRQPTRNSPR